MRQLLVVLAGVAMMSNGVACQHTAGKCDCLPPLPHCTKYGLFTPEMFVEPAPMKAEMLPPPPKPITSTGIAPDVDEPIRITPSVGVSAPGE